MLAFENVLQHVELLRCFFLDLVCRQAKFLALFLELRSLFQPGYRVDVHEFGSAEFAYAYVLAHITLDHDSLTIESLPLSLPRHSRVTVAPASLPSLSW